MRKLIQYLDLDKIGFIEIVLALYPILLSYRYGIIILAQVVLLALDLVVVLKGRTRILSFTPLVLFFVYYILHQIFGFIGFGLTQSYYINSFLGSIIYISSIFIIAPLVKFEKLEGSINWVSIICVLGLFYHVALMTRGEFITPIKLPFLPDPDMSQTRVFEEGFRPVSFFMEPQSYVGYLIFTLFYAVRNNKYIWAIIVSLSIILSTSTTGIAMIPIMFLLLLFGKKGEIYKKLIFLVVLGGLGIFFLNSPLASMGLDKLEDTELSSNIRTVNGPGLAKAMDIEDCFIGVPFANATDYYNGVAKFKRTEVIPDGNGIVFLPGFWTCFIFFGMIGLFLFLSIYFEIWKMNHSVLPILGCLVVTLFTNPDFLGGIWAFQMIFLLSYVKTNKRDIVNNESSNINNTVRK